MTPLQVTLGLLLGVIMAPFVLLYYAIKLPMLRFQRILEDAIDETLRIYK